MSRPNPSVDFPCRILNMMNLWNALSTEHWLTHESDAVTPEDFAEDAMILIGCNRVIQSAPYYPEVGEA